MIILNGENMRTRQDLHAELKACLNLPDYYGGNLDALNDCLGEKPEWEPVVIEHAQAFMEDCGIYADRTIRVFVMNGIALTLK